MTNHETDLIHAPWSAEQVTALNAFQHHGRMHPFTCGATHASGQSPVLVAIHSGWVCPDPRCVYRQDWAHAFMAKPAALEPAVSVPPPAPRADALRWAAEFAEKLMDERYGPDCAYGIGGLDVARELRRLADEAAVSGPVAGEQQAPLCRCGHGKAYHDAKYSDPQCRLCPEDGERMWRHAYTPAGGQPNETPETEAAAYRLAVTAIEAMPGYPRLVLPEEIVAELRRLADETPTTTKPAHQPRRGDAVEAWLKAQRDEYDQNSEFWHELDGALDRYRLHADTGTPLGEHVCEARVVGQCECLETPAAGVRQDGAQPSEVTVYLSTRCDACQHTLNWHRNDVGCTVTRCVCGRFQPPAEDGAQQ